MRDEGWLGEKDASPLDDDDCIRPIDAVALDDELVAEILRIDDLPPLPFDMEPLAMR